MKKYVKPMLFYEKFELSQNIAACGFDMNHSASLGCMAVGDETLGNEGIVFLGIWCGENAVLDGDGEMYCYENGPETFPDNLRVFNS